MSYSEKIMESPGAISKARHCIGMDRRKVYHRHGKAFYRPYRNYYACAATDLHWEILVDKGYAKREITPSGYIYYHMTQVGLDWLGEKLSVTIHDEED